MIYEFRKKYGDKIKVIAQTASVFNSKEVYHKAGFDNYITKPINSIELMSLISNYLA